MQWKSVDDYLGYCWNEIERIEDAINSTPGWVAEGGGVFGNSFSGYQISCMARHNGEKSSRVIRSMAEWQEEKRTHICPEGE